MWGGGGGLLPSTPIQLPGNSPHNDTNAKCHNIMKFFESVAVRKGGGGKARGCGLANVSVLSEISSSVSLNSFPAINRAVFSWPFSAVTRH